MESEISQTSIKRKSWSENSEDLKINNASTHLQADRGSLNGN